MLRDFAFIRSVLMPGERVVFATSLHWVVYVPGLLISFLGTGLSFGAMPALGQLLSGDVLATSGKVVEFVALGLCVIGLYRLLAAALKQSGTELVVTNQRVVAKTGIISRRTAELLLQKIEGANLQQSATGRLLGYGTIIVRGVGTNLAPIVGIEAPEQFQNALLAQINRLDKAAMQRAQK